MTRSLIPFPPRTDKTGQSDVAYDDYYNHDWQLLETRKGGDADPCTQYVWGRRYIDDLVCRHHDPNVDDNVQTHYYLGDANMNVTCLIDADGDAVERYDYAPYGRVAVFDGDWDPVAASAYDNAILFAGYRLDAGSPLYHVRNRMLHPTLGRWLQRDPAGYVDGMSAYEYGRGAPTIAVDPFGLETCEDRYSRCINDISYLKSECYARGSTLCSVLCILGKHTPACLTCITGYYAACNLQERADHKYCWCRYVNCLVNNTSRCWNFWGSGINPRF